MEKFKLEEQQLLVQSHDAYLAVQKYDEPLREREARAWNGDIVSESDSDNPDEYMLSFDDTRKNSLLHKKLTQVQRRAKRKRATLLSRQTFLGRKKVLEKVLLKNTLILAVIETFVEERSVGRGINF